MDLNAIQVILVIVVAFLAGMEGILDEWEFHQPLVACTLIGLVTGNLTLGIMLGGSLQMIALGWANIGAAVAPDTFGRCCLSHHFDQGWSRYQGYRDCHWLGHHFGRCRSILDHVGPTISTAIVHIMDKYAEKGNWRMINVWQWIAVCLQGLRIAIPAGLLLSIPTETVRSALAAMPAWLSAGMTIGGGMVVAVGYAMVINMMASREV